MLQQNLKKDNCVEKWCYSNNIDCYRGPEKNVLERYYRAAKRFNAEIIVKSATADDPFEDFRIIDEAIKKILKKYN